MSELYWMVNIVNGSRAQKFTKLYRECGVSLVMETSGEGTAVSEILSIFGLEATEKKILFSVVTGEKWKEVKQGLRRQIQIDIPGRGIAFIVPMSSIGGKKALMYFTDGQDYVKGEESTLKGTEYELLMVIANQGYSDVIMDAARGENARGGTVIHAKGTGAQQAEKFLGVTLAEEKEILLIVAKKADKNGIMKAIMEKAGLDSKARAIVFSLPVTDTAGMRLLDDDDED